MSVFDLINDWSAEEVLRRINLPLANDGKTHVCPICGNGTRGNPRQGHGIGIRPRINSKGRVRWKCHSCDKDFSNFDLMAATLSLYAESYTAETVRHVAEHFGLSESFFSFSRAELNVRTMWTPESREALRFEPKGEVEVEEQKTASVETPKKDYTRFYEFCRSKVDEFLAEGGGSCRGLTLETFKKYGLGVHPEFGLEGGEKSPHLIIPYDDTHFFARALVGHARGHHGAQAGLYETLPIKNTDDPFSVNFIVESEIDALSIAQELSEVFSGNTEMFGCVATGGTTKYNKVVPWLEKRFGGLKRKPLCIVLFDNDESGKKNGRLLEFELKAASYPAVIAFTATNPKSDKVDANDLLQRGKGELFGRLIDIMDEAERALKPQSEEMIKMAERARQEAFDKSGISISSFAGYFSADFYRDVDLTARYASRKTGFKNLDDLQIFLPGLYVLGALPAAGKTTFAWQMLNQLADDGEPCIYCSYEMSRAELFTKSLARDLYRFYPEISKKLNLSSANIRKGAGRDSEELQELVKKFARSSSKNLKVAELSNMGIAELIEKLKPLVAEVDKSPVICLDYLQIIPPSKDAKTSTTKEKLDDVIRRLKDFQRETNSTLIVISSFNRENYWQEVSFKSFKESGAIEYSADVIWGLQSSSLNTGDEATPKEIIEMSRKEEREIKFSCLKNRNGGQYTCHFRYYAAHDYFEAIEEKKENDCSTYVH